MNGGCCGDGGKSAEKVKPASEASKPGVAVDKSGSATREQAGKEKSQGADTRTDTKRGCCG